MRIEKATEEVLSPEVEETKKENSMDGIFVIAKFTRELKLFVSYMNKIVKCDYINDIIQELKFDLHSYIDHLRRAFPFDDYDCDYKATDTSDEKELVKTLCEKLQAYIDNVNETIKKAYEDNDFITLSFIFSNLELYKLYSYKYKLEHGKEN